MYGRHTGKVVADDGDEGKKVQGLADAPICVGMRACVRACR
jgi:hypothetical protein